MKPFDVSDVEDACRNLRDEFRAKLYPNGREEYMAQFDEKIHQMTFTPRGSGGLYNFWKSSIGAGSGD